MTLLLPILAASLLGSPHCAAMCGPLVCLQVHEPGGPSPRWIHAAYQAGRLAAYLVLGMLAGLLGQGVDTALTIPGLPRLSAILGGLFMILWGSWMVGHALGSRVSGTGGHPLGGLAKRFAAPLARRQPWVRASGLGLLSGLLPCGWLYVFVATAGGTGSVLQGMAVMGFFWLGSVPVLVAVALTARRVFGSLAPRLPLATAVVLIILGFMTLLGRFSPTLAGPGMWHAGH